MARADTSMGAPMDLHEQIDSQTDESLETTRRVRCLAEETQAMGGATMAHLNEQGDQMRRINRHAHSVDDNLRRSEATLTTMEKWWGLFTLPWKRQRKFEKKNAAYAAAFAHGELADRETGAPLRGCAAVLQPQQQPFDRQGNGRGVRGAHLAGRGSGAAGHPTGASGPGRFVTRVTHDPREDEMEENMEAVHAAVGDILEMSREMGRVLDEHLEMSSQLAAKIDVENDRIQVVNRRGNKLRR
mmetsp:Transcript_12683/g.32435  ORF Transcript_12683/g.32435 Transcript_12683/m.32435 type:complete len:243 (-) Transcript_12683:27-755(-)